METVKAAKLVLDMNLYPRRYINSYHVSGLRNALQANMQLPPVIADRRTSKVVDGFHRITATLKHLGEGADISVEWREYKDDTEMFADAVRLNANHGRQLYKADWVRCAAIGQDLGIEVEKMASLLCVTVPKLEHTLQVRTPAPPPDNGRLVEPLKPGQHRWAGKQLSKRQESAVRQTFGDVRRYASVLAQNLETGLLDLDDLEFIEELMTLKRVLDKVLESATEKIA